jgi:hypothetical protein
MLVHSPAPHEGQEFASRAWACPSCGHVELVVDWSTPAHADTEPLAEIAVSAPAPALPTPAEPIVAEAGVAETEANTEPTIMDLTPPALIDPIANPMPEPEREAEMASDASAADGAVMGAGATIAEPEHEVEMAFDAPAMIGEGAATAHADSARNGTGDATPDALVDPSAPTTPGATHHANGVSSARKKKPRAPGQEQPSPNDAATPNRRQSRSKRKQAS